jgi:hypothetical protein
MEAACFFETPVNYVQACAGNVTHMGEKTHTLTVMVGNAEEINKF